MTLDQISIKNNNMIKKLDQLINIMLRHLAPDDQRSKNRVGKLMMWKLYLMSLTGKCKNPYGKSECKFTVLKIDPKDPRKALVTISK